MAIESVRFEVVPDWLQQPSDETLQHEDVAGVACDSRDRVYLHSRRGDRISVYEEDGSFIRAWGDGLFRNAHGLTIARDILYTTDDGDNVVQAFDLAGDRKFMLGERGRLSDTGYLERPGPYRFHKNESIERVAGPFNGCCNTAVAPDGDMFVADGYGNARVHHFSADGSLVNSWGAIGSGPGEFHLPHGIAIDNDENIVVCDRENDRLQFFDRDGKYLYEWTDIQRPTQAVVDKDGLVYVTELWRPVEPGQGSFRLGYPDRDLPGRVTVFRKDGRVVARFGADSANRSAPGNFIAPHGLALDSHGNLYVGEVSGNYGARAGRLLAEQCRTHQIQKFARVE